MAHDFNPSTRGSLPQPYLMGIAKVIKQAQLPDKDSKAEPLDGCCTTFAFHLYLLHTWETVNICKVWGYWIDGKFLMNHLCLLPALLLLRFPKTVLNVPLLLL